MLRLVIPAGRLVLSRPYLHQCARCKTIHTAVDEEQEAARVWVAQYNENKISPQSCTVTYCRSSGPGGQKVNKTSSKAMLRLNLEDIRPTPPKLILEQLANSRYASDKGRVLVIHADTSRKQGDNKDDCFSKLDALVTECCSNVITKEASPEQLKKIQILQAAENQRRLAIKKAHSSKKAFRRGD